MNAIGAWFGASNRELPWRALEAKTGRRNAYHSLVSELMLQQTQVSRVVDAFTRFIERFPTPQALADAPEDAVLAAWSGLGYYRRARLLHRAAKEIVARHGGVVPCDVAALRELPGVGRYTAGAVASMAFGLAEPLVDGNVVRVLSRVEGRRGAADEPATMAWTWERAGELVSVGGEVGPGVFNEGLMELGATVCTPRNPACGGCPVNAWCVAKKRGLTATIPAPKKAARRASVVWRCVVLVDRRGRVLLERRGGAGLWAGMWQVPTIEDDGETDLARTLGVPRAALEYVGAVRRVLTHRRVEFRVWRGEVARASGVGGARRWVEIGDSEFGVPAAFAAVIELGVGKGSRGV